MNKQVRALVLVILAFFAFAGVVCRSQQVQYMELERIERAIRQLRQAAQEHGKSIEEIEALVDSLRQRYRAKDDGTQKDNQDQR